ncbi:hypothetical protein LVJ94_19550 [Pendulispora rubella]|uniref:Uncharacterized protein n=1 Tax=Pendulispora rubella TaxID=2741070 RepID=A0ABZ2LEP6_9BACT
MAAKFDGKHARANLWVTHQNLARAKGGRPQYQPPVRKGPKPPKDTAAHTANAEPATAAAPAIAEVPAGDETGA